MKKTILISVGVLIILVIIGVWVYLFMFGAPKNGADIFANFGSGNTDITATVPNDVTVDTGDVSQNGEKQALKQLTIRPVAGAGFTSDGISYVEQGTGHVYHINLSSGEEKILSSVTIPGAQEALFSKQGTKVAISTLDGITKKTIVRDLTSESNVDTHSIMLPINAHDISFGNATGTILYSLKNNDGMGGYSYSLTKETNTNLFVVPLKEARVLWGKDTYIYTTPTASQAGYIYKIVKNELKHVASGGNGLMGFVHNGHVIITKILSGQILSTYLDDKQEVTQEFPLIPEKCTSSETILICAIPHEITHPNDFPDIWYKGSDSYSDTLWYIDIIKKESYILSDFLLESGREIDVSTIGTNTDGTYIYFINKNDNTLWMFDTTI